MQNNSIPLSLFLSLSLSFSPSHFNVAINCSPNQELTCGHHIAKDSITLISNCTTALEIEVLPFE